MRAIFIGASATTLMAVRKALDQGHEAVVVEKDEEKVEQVSEQLDCSFVVDDGSRPATLQELSPENTDILFSLTDSDHDNIIAGLVARSLGFERVVVKIDDPDLEPICVELGLSDVMIPSREIGHSLIDLLEGRERPELASVLRGGWRFWVFVAPEGLGERISNLDLPERARVIAVTREDETQLVEPDTELCAGDQVLVLAHEEEMDGLRDRYGAS